MTPRQPLNASLSSGSSLAELYGNLVKAKKLQDDASQRKIIAALENILQLLEEKPTRRSALLSMLAKPSPPDMQGLYIWGSVGRGKSMVMDLFYHQAKITSKRRQHFHSFMQEVHKKVHELRVRHPQKIQEENPIISVARSLARQLQLLCLDELQVTDVADAMILEQLFTTLFEEGVICIFTSNRPPESLYLNGLQRDRFLRFVGLLTERIKIMELSSPQDYRLQQIRAMHKVYLTPLNKRSIQEFENIFSTLCYPSEPEFRQLAIQGRKLKIMVAAGKAARFTFHELCEKPLGAADYLEIARHFHTVMLSDIPVMTPEKRNEARRFVTLIDVLYDHKVKLVCTADAPPDALYPAGDGAFEFARTASRLMEMQSAAYLEASHIN